MAWAWRAGTGQLLGTSARPYRYSSAPTTRIDRSRHPDSQLYRLSSMNPRLYACPASGTTTRAPLPYATYRLFVGPPTSSPTLFPVPSRIRYAWPATCTVQVSPSGTVATTWPEFGSPSSRSAGPPVGASRIFSLPWTNPTRSLPGADAAGDTLVPE